MTRALFVFSIDGQRRFDRRPIAATAIQLGISYIAALLREHAHQTSLLVLESRGQTEELKLVTTRLRDFEPDLVCHTAVATQYPFIVDVARHIRDTRPDVCQVIGGPHVSLNPEQAMRDGFDAACVGEGEHAGLELAEQLGRGRLPTGIGNLWIRSAGGVERNVPRPFLADLDTLPLPDRGLWDEWLDRSRPPIHTVLLGRGCPFQCTYCCNHALRKLAPGSYVRMRSPAAIVREVASLAAAPDVEQSIYLEVETLMLAPEWVEALCSRLAVLNAGRRRPIRFGANIRVTPNADLARFFQAFAQANICWVNIGLESGSERIRRDVLKRYYSNADVLRTVEMARAHRMRVALYNLVGLPGESPRDFLETARMNRLCRPDARRTSIFFPYPGTELHRLCQERGLLPAKIPVGRERRRAALDLPGFSRRRIQECFDFFDVYVAHANPLVRRMCILAGRYLGPLRVRARRVPGYWRLKRHTEGAVARLSRLYAQPKLDRIEDPG